MHPATTRLRSGYGVTVPTRTSTSRSLDGAAVENIDVLVAHEEADADDGDDEDELNRVLEINFFDGTTSSSSSAADDGTSSSSMKPAAVQARDFERSIWQWQPRSKFELKKDQYFQSLVDEERAYGEYTL